MQKHRIWTTTVGCLLVVLLLSNFEFATLLHVANDLSYGNKVRSIVVCSFQSSHTDAEGFILTDSVKKVYNTSGKIIEWTSFMDISPDVSGKKYIFQYDSNGHLIASESYINGEGLDSKSEKEYNKKGKLIRSTTFNTVNRIIRVETCEYNLRGNKCKWKSFTNGVLEYYQIHRFNRNGNTISKIGYKPDGSLAYEFYYKYDLNYNLVEMKSKDHIYKNDYRSEHSYDSIGNRIESRTYALNGQLTNKWSFDFVYDDKGNWVKQYMYNYGELKGYITREISYYQD
jgi:hypothetical protein